MKTLIVSYSNSGNNDLLANHLQKRLSADLFRVSERKKRTGLTIFLDILFDRTPEIREFYHVRDFYEHHILIGPVWAGRIASPLKSFLLNEKSKIGRYSFISASGGAPNQQSKLAGSLEAIVGHKPEKVLELSISELFRSRGRKSPATDYKLTADDWKFFDGAIDEFTSKLEKIERTKIQAAHYQ
jgi:flavodoxin